MKRCTWCEKKKPLSAFYANSKTSDGHESQCKECKRANAKAWRKKYPERVTAQRKAWHKAHPDANARYCRAYCERNPEKVRAIKRASAKRFIAGRSGNNCGAI